MSGFSATTQLITAGGFLLFGWLAAAMSDALTPRPCARRHLRTHRGCRHD